MKLNPANIVLPHIIQISAIQALTKGPEQNIICLCKKEGLSNPFIIALSPTGVNHICFIFAPKQTAVIQCPIS